MIRRERLPVADLVVDPLQARDTPWTGDEPDRRLAESLATDGLLQDILVRPLECIDTPPDTEAGSYAIVAGSRRYHAAMDAGYETIQCKIIDADDLDAAWTSLLENTDRKDLSEGEIAEQLGIIYEMVRPIEEPQACPYCNQSVAGEAGLAAHYGQTDCHPPTRPDVISGHDSATYTPGEQRFISDRQARRYLAWRFLGRADDGGVDMIHSYLRTAALPSVVGSLFKTPQERSETERTALDNYGIDTETTLGSGDGSSGIAREIAALHEAVDTHTDETALDPEDAILETVGTLQHDELSSQQFRQTLRDLRHELTADLEAAPDQRQQFSETLQSYAEDLHELCDELEPHRPFRKVDVMGPETHRHSRWHSQEFARREISTHSELVRELYHERLEALAEQAGWE